MRRNVIMCAAMCFVCLTKSESMDLKTSEEYSLRQVVILSRHGLRSPLSIYLPQMSPKLWPSWNEKPGYLTAKGAILEGYMGSYFASWFKEKRVLNDDCPTEDMFYIYSNKKQRTLASSKAFIDNAFPNCNITIHRTNEDSDPIFSSVIHNTSAVFRNTVLNEMEKILKSLKLNVSYEQLDKILDYQDSALCRINGQCDLTTDENNIAVVPGEKPNASGPIKIGNSVADAFVMQFYEGFDIENVAWGYLRNENEWKTLMELSNGYHNVIFNNTLVASDIAKPILCYIRNIFIDNKHKVSLLMGHDANMYTVLKALLFKPYKLQRQHELAPIGGKMVFQKWHNNLKKVNLLKVEYVYQSTEQLRNSLLLNLKNPPQFQMMELQDCRTDKNGFCLWTDFENILDNFKPSYKRNKGE